MKPCGLNLFSKDGLVPLEKDLFELWGTADSLGGTAH